MPGSLAIVRPAEREPRRRLGCPSSLGRRIRFALAALVVGLVLIGQGIFLVRVATSGGSQGIIQSFPRTGTLSQRLHTVVNTALGGSDRGVRRFAITAITTDPARRTLKDVSITWAINDDISAGSVGNGAQLDVFAMLRNIYSAHLPIALVRLRGTYPVPQHGGSAREATVMRLSMTRHVANVIGQGDWSNVDPESVWALTHRAYVNPDFQPLPSE